MQNTHTQNKIAHIERQLKKGVSKIAPLWSLDSFVAVNPYLGIADMNFAKGVDYLDTCGGIQSNMPLSFYLKSLKKGKITLEDITAALQNFEEYNYQDADQFITKIIDEDFNKDDIQIKTTSDVASEINGKRWKRFMVDRISSWAAAYFDQKQANWKTADSKLSIFNSWKQEAEVDFSTEVMGLKEFRKTIKALPENYLEAALEMLEFLAIPEEDLDHYFNSLLLKMNGWAGFAARIDWDAKLNGRESDATVQFLTIMLAWEFCLLKLLPYHQLETAWRKAKNSNSNIINFDPTKEKLMQRIILQHAYDHSNQRRLIQKINNQNHTAEIKKERPKTQAIFCIDVRSELFRRNLEAADAGIETLGFAGFFGFPIHYVPLGQSQGSNQCPVLLTPSYTIKEGYNNPKEETKTFENRLINAQFAKAWKTFKSSAISCFSFVSPLGLYFLPKLIIDTLNIGKPKPAPNQSGYPKSLRSRKSVKIDHITLENQVSGIALEDRNQLAHNALKAMSLTENFARIVLVTGHGANTTNNPHATGLDCGACGGQSGEANAKVAATVLNDEAVRKSLKDQGIDIPKDTLFIAALHDTTSDEVTLFNPNNDWPKTHQKDIEELTYALKIAGQTSRKERSGRMNIEHGNIDQQIIKRTKDWSQVRPEWGLAGCSSFIVAPRSRTANLNLSAKSFLHNYNWKKDKDFGILELIMTAPMVVTSWINLQYYASTVDNKKMGAGNKTLHNIVGGLGVFEGLSGDLKVGLPWQSVHDGKKFQNEPYRLNVIIEAPLNQMSKVLEKHNNVRQLCDNQWIFLFAMDEDGKVKYKYKHNLQWEILED